MRDYTIRTAKDLRRLIASLSSLSLRGKVVGWLFLFLIFYRSGMPVLYSAALAALPWLLYR